MQARNAMIVWNPATAELLEGLPEGRGRLTSRLGGPPEVQVYHNDDQVAHRRHDQRLMCSLGACMLGWCEQNALSDVFRAFLSVASDGVPLEDIHRQFLQIDEYAEMVGDTSFFGIEIPEED